MTIDRPFAPRGGGGRTNECAGTTICMPPSQLCYGPNQINRNDSLIIYTARCPNPSKPLISGVFLWECARHDCIF